MNGIKGKNVLLIIGGGIAAYKALDLIRRLKERGANMRTILTSGARQFITPLSAGALSEAPVFADLFDLKDETEIGHIRLAREADLIIVAPATANLLARMAHGLADDLATAVLLAADKPVLVAPAMNVRMWEHPATQRNVSQLRQDGLRFVGPGEGGMACGEWGMGRMAEVQEIIAAAEAMLTDDGEKLLSGVRVLVTAGPTREPIDPVRYLTNRSSGKQGYALAAAAATLGAHVTLISGPVALPEPPGVDVMRVETARQMLEAVERALPADVAIFAAAVADWRVAEVSAGKLKKSGAVPPQLALAENPDILRTVASRKTERPKLVIGFAAETEDVLANAKAKLAAKGCDWIVANDVSHGTGILGGDRNRVFLVTAQGRVEPWEEMSKDDVARRLMRRVAEVLTEVGR